MLNEFRCLIEAHLDFLLGVSSRPIPVLPVGNERIDLVHDAPLFGRQI